MKKLLLFLIIPFLSFGQWYDYDICVYANISVGSCDSLSNGQINLEVAGGVPPYMYVVEPCGNFTDCLWNLSPGNYNITVIDANGCTVSGDVEVCDPCESWMCSDTYSDSFCGNDCDAVSMAEAFIPKKILTTIDILGRETNNNKGFQLHIYNDGTVEKKYVIK